MNPGSVGQPRDGDPRAAWMLLDLGSLVGRVAPHGVPRGRGRGGDRGGRAATQPGRSATRRAVTRRTRQMLAIARSWPAPRSPPCGCGGSDEPEGKGLPAATASELERRLDEIERRYREAVDNGNVGACDDIQNDSIPAVNDARGRPPRRRGSRCAPGGGGQLQPPARSWPGPSARRWSPRRPRPRPSPTTHRDRPRRRPRGDHHRDRRRRRPPRRQARRRTRAATRRRRRAARGPHAARPGRRRAEAGGTADGHPHRDRRALQAWSGGWARAACPPSSWPSTRCWSARWP